jgi:hypothetical protein
VCLIVPWRAEIKGESGSLTASLGYSPIFWPPAFNGYEPGNFVSVDYPRVILEIIAITVLSVMLIVIKQRSAKGENNDEKS